MSVQKNYVVVESHKGIRDKVTNGLLDHEDGFLHIQCAFCGSTWTTVPTDGFGKTQAELLEIETNFDGLDRPCLACGK